MLFKAISPFFSEVEKISTDMKKTVRTARYVQEQTSSARVEIGEIEAKIDLIIAEIDLTETLQKMSSEQLDFFYKAANEERPTVMKSTSELNRQKSELEQQLTLKQRFLQEQTEIAENDIK
ncbi:hypothetical protein FCV43_18595 [Vibrio genomosp. F6]|uniref:hypothetical protein n=1 Tax=Vibrio genomosp. F6 TaxID=723172 RepID=UPI0010BD0EDD|nr:hypothetical protein [Vibrio genomosp. F6]TKF15643.1 hypothetical protein FCV43_18595 [Vibrio genomosp. F6]